jgi:hypothetical protein
LDSFRDEDFIYEKVQRENYGIKKKLDVLPPNSYWLFFPALKVRTSSEITWLLAWDWLLERTPNLGTTDTDAKLPVS